MMRLCMLILAFHCETMASEAPNPVVVDYPVEVATRPGHDTVFAIGDSVRVIGSEKVGMVTRVFADPPSLRIRYPERDWLGFHRTVIISPFHVRHHD